jgi:hypothetical protein
VHNITTVADGTAISSQDVEELLSEALLTAIAARAGFVTSKPSLDRKGVDLTVEGAGGYCPKIDVQLKASVGLTIANGTIKYSLKKRNYELLRRPTQTPRMLVLMRLPKLKGAWLSASTRLLSIRHCAYWMCLEGMPPSKNSATVTISIPTKNLLTVKALNDLMKRSESGSLL